MTPEIFLKAICADPGNDAPRLIYADWLDEQGDPRGRFIRLQIELANLGQPPIRLHHEILKHVGDGVFQSNCPLTENGLDIDLPLGSRVDIEWMRKNSKTQMMYGLLVVKKKGEGYGASYLLKKDARSRKFPLKRWNRLMREEGEFFDLKLRWLRDTGLYPLDGFHYYSRGFVSRVRMGCPEFLRVGKDLIQQTPLERVEFLDKSPHDRGDMVGWYVEWKHLRDREDLPKPIYDRLKGCFKSYPLNLEDVWRWYKTKDDAADAASDAAIRWAKGEE